MYNKYLFSIVLISVFYSCNSLFDKEEIRKELILQIENKTAEKTKTHIYAIVGNGNYVDSTNIEIQSGVSIIHKWNPSLPKTDGGYKLVDRDHSISFGYFSNGVPSGENTFSITILEDSVMIK